MKFANSRKKVVATRSSEGRKKETRVLHSTCNQSNLKHSKQFSIVRCHHYSHQRSAESPPTHFINSTPLQSITMARVSPLPSVASTVRAYALPIVLFAGAMYYQLFVIPNAFPSSHYDGISLLLCFILVRFLFILFYFMLSVLQFCKLRAIVPLIRSRRLTTSLNLNGTSVFTVTEWFHCRFALAVEYSLNLHTSHILCIFRQTEIK